MSDHSNGQRVAIVTGGARGIGAAITTALARSGVHVAAGYSSMPKWPPSSPASSAPRARRCRCTKATSVSVHQANVGEPADCNRVVDDVLEQRGRVDYLINNAGITVDKTMRKMTSRTGTRCCGSTSRARST
jgi:NAD(P)-dependent dehydrogenase (short-subunit alcohol dehydrogenase family)